MEPFRFHLFVCAQQKPEGVPSCPANGSLAVLAALDREITACGLGSDVQVTTCGCMGLCDEGPIMVVYPEGVWYRRVQPSDVAEIAAQHLLAWQACRPPRLERCSGDEGHVGRAWGKVP